MLIILLLPFLAFFLWLYAEAKLGRNYRVVSGLACMALTGFACHTFAMIIPRYEQTFHRGSIRLMGELLDNGQARRVQQAIQNYNAISSTGTSYSASMKMWGVLNHGPDK
jgi:hypothetical protein